MERDNSFTLNDAEIGLLKREMILDRLKLKMAFCQRYHKSLAICYLRLILPKEININTDIEIVHYLRKTFVDRLTQAVRNIDSIGKMNETDILLILSDVNEIESEEIVKRILNLISGTYTYKNRHFTLNFSIGICIYPYGGNNVEALLNNAKMEMYNAFELGTRKYSFFNGNQNDSAYRKLLIENDLNYAIRLNQFKVLYQPQLSIKTRKVIGVEVLIRWNHPKLGYISPEEFIPIAETTGKSTVIFYWVLEEVCQHIKEIKQRDFPDIKYSITFINTCNLQLNYLGNVVDVYMYENGYY
ncbi:Diguanylate cyclase/phosphodiesterase with PAS/PAC sensor(S) OS=Ureibacillus acetophenoni OX=614649 GN=SAMN05877842_10692 PE=4 SV=1 [Ureibacillus acetophenoni]